MNKIKTIKPFFKDKRGTISHLVSEDIVLRGIVLITCKKGSIRANHYHKKDTHYSYMVAGKMEYSWKDLSKTKSPLRKIVVSEGQMITTPPMIAHAMRFIEDSVFIAMTTRQRNRKNYEEDTIRVSLI